MLDRTVVIEDRSRKGTLIATAVAALMVGAAIPTLAFMAGGTDAPIPAVEPTSTAPAGAHDTHSDAGAVHDHRSDRFAWTPEAGEVPTREEAESKLTRLYYAYIEDDAAFNPENGVSGGSGTPEDPYIFEGLYVVRDLYIADTSKYFIVRNSYIGGQFTLNWVGDRVYVHHNYVHDLRVNENVRRTGDATGGLVEANVFGYVGQIRHYDGVFRNNEVGPYPGDWLSETTMGAFEWPWSDPIVLNIDGFHGADFSGNTILGTTNIDLHGHHHGSCFECHSHHHGDDSRAMEHDHSVRYHWIDFHDNVMTVESGVALLYDDRNHAGDDRRAASENSESLEGPHTHFTRVILRDNVLQGGGILVDVFNADDRYHKERNPGELVIRGNTITVKAPTDEERTMGLWYHEALDGIHVTAAKEVGVAIEGNRVAFVGEYQEPDDEALTGWLTAWMDAPPPAGVRLDGFLDADILVRGNTVAGTYYGVKAERFEQGVTWRVVDNTFEDVAHDVYWDDSVGSGPGESGV